MGFFVIAAYRPKPGKAEQLLQVVRDHLPILRGQKLVTDRPAYAMRATDGTIVEVFEWKSKEAVDQAHTNPEVLKLWKRFDECCTYGRLADLPEINEMFPHFEPIELPA
jgi:hypothetical protein